MRQHTAFRRRRACGAGGVVGDSPPARGGVARSAGVVGASSATASRIAGGRPRAPVTFSLLAHKRKSPKRKGAPVHRRYLASSCGSPALLDRPGGLRNSRKVRLSADSSGAKCSGYSRRDRGSPSARPKPRAGLRCLAALRGPRKFVWTYLLPMRAQMSYSVIGFERMVKKESACLFPA